MDAAAAAAVAKMLSFSLLKTENMDAGISRTQPRGWKRGPAGRPGLAWPAGWPSHQPARPAARQASLTDLAGMSWRLIDWQKIVCIICVLALVCVPQSFTWFLLVGPYKPPPNHFSGVTRTRRINAEAFIVCTHASFVISPKGFLFSRQLRQ